ncbi:MAG: HAMP domain-containing sensor histidine kinase [Spirochaetaceae bacterium]|jgi:Amt family ammonium transporter|nr:HAMP domain-containing sensor histidine kinase [Spirochaetaceae bacterium]
MIKNFSRFKETISGILIILILIGVSFTFYFDGIKRTIFYSLSAFSLFSVSIIFFSIKKDFKKLNGRLKKTAEENKQLLDYINASWDSNQNLIHEEKILAIKYMMVGISHEINTPLGNAFTSISILENLIAKENLNEKDIITALNLSQLNIKRTIDLVNRFKEVVQTTLGEERKKFNLENHLQSIVKVKKNDWSKDPVKIKIRCPGDLILYSFPHSLRIILDVFLDNARESFSGSYGEITIQCEQNGKNLKLIIEDTGIGIKPEKLEEIFQPFYTTKRGENHLGLGLSMAHNLTVNLFGGELNVNSIVGKGTKMQVFLPDSIEALKVIL